MVAVSSVHLKFGTMPTETACQPLARSGKLTAGAAVSGPAAIMVPATSSVSNDMVRQRPRLPVGLSASAGSQRSRSVRYCGGLLSQPSAKRSVAIAVMPAASYCSDRRATSTCVWAVREPPSR